MLSHRLSKRLVPTLTAYLLLVSVGLPLQRIYCTCLDQQWVSLTEPEHHCEHKHDDTDKPACQSDCRDVEVLLAPLDADFLSEQKSFVDLHLVAVLPEVAPLPWPTKPVLTKAVPIRGPTPPPLPSGRDLLVAHQTFLI
ncbi:MAG: hypothetical protein AAFZ52_00080 [Bacteroidota bacterium]